jgi:hypothetical protein
MNQARILALLHEAASPKCSEERLMNILCIFEQESFALTRHKSFQSTTPESGIVFLMDRLFEKIVEHDRSQFPALFPVFALICGDKEEGALTAPEIHWSTVAIK